MQAVQLPLVAQIAGLASSQPAGLTVKGANNQQAVDFKAFLSAFDQLNTGSTGTKFSPLIDVSNSATETIGFGLLSEIPALQGVDVFANGKLPHHGNPLPVSGNALPVIQSALVQNVDTAESVTEPLSNRLLSDPVLAKELAANLVKSDKTMSATLQPLMTADTDTIPTVSAAVLSKDLLKTELQQPEAVSAEYETELDLSKWLAKQANVKLESTAAPIIDRLPSASIELIQSQVSQVTTHSTLQSQALGIEVGSNHLAAVDARAAFAESVVSQTPSQAANTASDINKLNIDVRQADYDQQLSRSMSWLIERGQQQARLTLNPPELGTVNVQLELQQNEVKLSLLTHTAAARDSLDAALPRLRELMGEQGMNLVQAEVSQQQGHGAQSRGYEQGLRETEAEYPEPIAGGGDAEDEGAGAVLAQSSDTKSLLDEYA